MKTRLFSIPCLLLPLLLGGASLHAQTPTPDASVTPAIQTDGEAAAQTAADVWLALFDDGQYAKNWQTASGPFQKFVTEEQWTKLAAAARTPLGKLVTRTKKDSTFSKTLPGLPDGQYVIIHYDASFEHKKTAVETVTVMLDQDGQWKVSGYYIK